MSCGCIKLPQNKQSMLAPDTSHRNEPQQSVLRPDYGAKYNHPPQITTHKSMAEFLDCQCVLYNRRHEFRTVHDRHFTRSNRRTARLFAEDDAPGADTKTVFPLASSPADGVRCNTASASGIQ